MKRRERSPDRTVEQKGRFTVVTEEVPGNDPKRARPGEQPPQQTAPAEQPPPAQQPPQAPPGPQPPQQPGGGVEQQEAANQDRPPPEPPPRGWVRKPGASSCGASDSVPSRTGGGAGGRCGERVRRGVYENQMRNQDNHLSNLPFLPEVFHLDAILTLQEFKGIGTAVERISAQGSLTTAEDIRMNSSFTFQPFIETFPGFLLPNTKVRGNVVSNSIVITASDSCLIKVMAIFAADFDSNIGIQDCCCPHLIEFKHLVISLHCIEEIGSLLLTGTGGDFSMSGNLLPSLQLHIPEKYNFLIHATVKGCWSDGYYLSPELDCETLPRQKLLLMGSSKAPFIFFNPHSSHNVASTPTCQSQQHTMFCIKSAMICCRIYRMK